MDAWLLWPLLCLAAFLAGAVNSMAGGGTLLTFPALLTVLTPVVANTTSTVALVPGSIAGAWGYRNELQGNLPWLRLLLAPSLAGGLLGSVLLLSFPGVFERVVPWLLLLAALLFMFQPVLNRFLKGHDKAPDLPSADLPSPVLAIVLVVSQFLIGIYGGYFGAGIGILMLSALGLMGLHDIHAMNAVKTLLASAINLTSVVVFVAYDRFVQPVLAWQYGPVMAIASIVGGYAGARVSRRLPRPLVRWTVIAVGLGLAGYSFAKQWGLIPADGGIKPA
jgi:uncharacterized protein